MPDPVPDVEDLPLSFFLKRGTLYGAGLGMLAGLIYLAIAGVDADEEVASIIVWRNCILIGAGIGLIAGGGLGWWYRRLLAESDAQNRPEENPPNDTERTS